MSGIVGHQVDLIVRDVEATAAFLALLDLDVAVESEWPPGSGAHHAEVALGPQTGIGISDHAMAAIWRGAPQEHDTGTSIVFSLVYATADEVDAVHHRVVAAGHASARAPHGAFWGARYAIVIDPDGHHIGVMGPVVPAARYIPAVDGGR